jgi:fatty acid kinase
MARRACDGAGLLGAFRAAAAALEASVDEVNALNVFPVPDGDTGSNMMATVRAALAEAEALGPTVSAERVASAAAFGALMGARGNSGVIASQILRGLAEGLAGKTRFNALDLANALDQGTKAAYGAVAKPVEGTILTVIREASAAAVVSAERERTLDAVMKTTVAAAQAAVAKTPSLLPILREAGVVDAGGFGLTVIFAGVVAALRGAEAPELDHHAPARVTHPQHESSTYRYCTNFAVTGEGMDPSAWIESLESIGDSVLVVGDQRTLKVHVHTDEPERATALFQGVGSVSRLDVADMHEQIDARAERLAEPTAACGVVAVVAGKGMEELFISLGATPLPGGPTLNPSTYELLAGIHEVPAEEVVVLPNSPNVLMAAERAAELSEKKVFVVPTRSQQAGLAAAVALDSTRGAEANGQAMLEALAPVRTGAVTEAARDDAEARPARFHRGDAVGFIDERIVAWGEPAETLEVVLGELGREAELVTLIAGDGAPLDGDAVAALAPAGVEVEYSWGGQPAYWWLIAAE